MLKKNIFVLFSNKDTHFECQSEISIYFQSLKPDDPSANSDWILSVLVLANTPMLLMTLK